MLSLNKTLSIVLALVILATAAAFVYTVAVPAAEPLTEFYMLGAGGQAGRYPQRLAPGEEGALTMVIVNRERETLDYRVEIRVDGVTQGELGPVTLGHGEELEQAVSFVLDRPGPGQKVEFLLYRQGQSGVYESVYLLVDVEEGFRRRFPGWPG